MRLLSLLPAATDIACTLGAADRLVGITHECDAPAARAVARVTGTPVDVHAAAASVDMAVRALHDAGAPLFTLDEAAILAAAPDVILTQALCDVCAVSEADVRALAARLTPAPRVLSLGATTFDGVLDEIRVVGEAIGLADEADEWIAGARARLRRIHEALSGVKAPWRTVAVVEWTDPLYAAGHWTPQVVRRAGGRDVLAEPGSHSLVVDVGIVRERAPELVLVAPCGYDLDRASAAGAELLARDDWGWAAAREVWAVDANRLLSRPGPNVVRAVEVLAEIMHPALFGPPDPSLARRVG